MLVHEHDGDVYVLIDAEFDAITCPGCRVCVPQGQACPCSMRTKGPSVENQTRKMLTGDA